MQKPKKMDTRCPLKLEEQPARFCPLAVQRLKALRHAGRELTEEEEALLPGCQWAVNHQLANYCFFNYITQYPSDKKAISDMETAHLCNISIETVKQIEKTAIKKLKESEEMKEVSDEYGQDVVISDNIN
jgi:hypothetical protein